MRKWMVRLLAALTALLCIAAAGCAGEPASSAASEPEATVPPLLNVDIGRLLTAEEVSDALGTPVKEAQVLDDGTRAAFYAADNTGKVDVVMDQCGRDVFDLRLGLYEGLVDAPNLGDIAKWHADTGELLVYSHGYMFSVAVESADKSADDQLLAARQLAVRIVEVLAVGAPTKE